MGISRIGDLLDHSLNRHGARRGVVAAQVVDTANIILAEIFGAEIHSHAKVHAFVRGELRVRFTDAFAASEIRQRAEEILTALRARLPGVVIERVRALPATDQPLP